MMERLWPTPPTEADRRRSSLAILANCRKAMSGESELLLVERVLPERAEDDPGTIMVDVQMLAVTGGRERSEAEYRALFEAAGLTLTTIVPIRTPFYIFAGVC